MDSDSDSHNSISKREKMSDAAPAPVSVEEQLEQVMTAQKIILDLIEKQKSGPPSTKNRWLAIAATDVEKAVVIVKTALQM